MIDDSVLVAGVQLVRTYAQAADDAQKKLTSNLLALGIPLGLHDELLGLVQRAGGMAVQINESIANAKIPSASPASQPVIGPGPAPTSP